MKITIVYPTLLFIVITYMSGIVPALSLPKTSTLNPDDSVPFALSISGGVSLGSYEAGINWALLHYLKISREKYINNERPLYPDLKSISGASAGSINALISAINWCVDKSKVSKNNSQNNDQYKFVDDIDNNLFRDIWVEVGFEQLLPNPLIKANYKADDGLFTRNAFNTTISRLRSMLSQAVFRNDCSIPFGITVTRVLPSVITVAGIEVENQRYIIPIRLEASHQKNGSIVISSHIVNQNDPFIGNVMYLQGKLDPEHNNKLTISIDDLIDAILASSSFPVAFGRKKIKYCTLDNELNYQKSEVCPQGYVPETNEFLDGGVFDNVPLGIAKALSEPLPTLNDSQNGIQKPAKRYNYIYIDPDNLRIKDVNKNLKSTANVNQNNDHPTPMTFGLRNQLKFLSGAISTSRNYELYTILRGGEWSHQTFPYACKLYSIANNINNNSCIPSSKTSNNSCKKLYTRLSSSKTLSVQQQKDVSVCLINEAIDLEIEYNTKTKNKNFKRHQCENKLVNTNMGQKTLNARNCLLKKLYKLSIILNQPELSFSISNAIHDEYGDRRILLTTRYAQITGNKLGNFGAFLDPAFREYDYYAGVYDSIILIANYFCKRTRQASCVALQSKKLFYDFKIERIPEAINLMTLLFKNEHQLSDDTKSPWDWVKELKANKVNTVLGKNISIIFKSLQQVAQKNLEIKSQGRQEKLGVYDEFVYFAHALMKNNYDVSESSPFMNRVFRLKDSDPLSWFYPISTAISSRLIILENNEIEVSKGSEYFRQLLGIGALTVHSFIKNKDHSLMRHTSAPMYSWQRYLPYEAGVDVRNGGIKIAWEPSIYLSNKYSIDLNIAPISYNKYSNVDIYFSQLNAFISKQSSGLISSYGIGPSFSYTWEKFDNSNQSNLGASLYLGFLRDKFRLTVGQRSEGISNFFGNSFYLAVSVTDIPGIVYWLGY